MSNAESNVNYAQNPVINEKYNSIVKAMDATCFTKIEESEDPAVRLSKFYYNTFTIGTSNVVETLVNEYKDAIDNETAKMDEYVLSAIKAKTAIEKAIEQDKKAHETAKEAMIKALNDYPSFTSLCQQGRAISADSYNNYCTERANAGNKAYNDTWNAKCWKPKA